ncbi:tetratricopeptide repeat protein [Vibrio mexicanus]|uniref:tetratricopeptide repeat protein n=1 Tax=Vibrio mexicanus TaxID=1004326 RepID=UPI000A81B4CF|nr:hypothetical protein [Vibrio mexicanus]
MRLFRLPTIGLLLMSCTAFAQPDPLRSWEALYEQTLKVNESKALALLQQKYRALPIGYEKLYMSSKLYNFMNKRNQPFHGSSNLFNNDYKQREDKFIQALNLENELNFKEAIEIYMQLLAEARQIGSLKGQELLSYQLCRSVNKQGHYYQASLHCNELEKLLSEQDYTLLPKYKSLRVIANNYEFIGDYQGALATYRKLLEVTPTYRDPSGTYNDVGLLLKRMSQLEQSSNFLNKALELRKANGTPLELAQTYHSLGDLMISSRNTKQALNILIALIQFLNNTTICTG